MQSDLRIISFLPCATELICELGLRDALVGISHECDFPENVKALPRLTRSEIPMDLASDQVNELVKQRIASGKGLFSIEEDRFCELRPSLIVTQGLCDVCAVSEEDVRQLAGSLSKQPKIVNLNPRTLGC